LKVSPLVISESRTTHQEWVTIPLVTSHLM
jgi:hypothetical protein